MAFFYPFPENVTPRKPCLDGPEWRLSYPEQSSMKCFQFQALSTAFAKAAEKTFGVPFKTEVTVIYDNMQHDGILFDLGLRYKRYKESLTTTDPARVTQRDWNKASRVAVRIEPIDGSSKTADQFCNGYIEFTAGSASFRLKNPGNSIPKEKIEAMKAQTLSAGQAAALRPNKPCKIDYI